QLEARRNRSRAITSRSRKAMSVLFRSSMGRMAAAALWFLGSIAAVQGEAARNHGVDPLNVPDTQLEPLTWGDLDGWTADDHAAAFAAFRISCGPFLHYRKPPNEARPIYVGLWAVCRRAAAAGDLAADKDKARAFFEDNFRPVRIAKLGETSGLLTGYYEPIV